VRKNYEEAEPTQSGRNTSALTSYPLPKRAKVRALLKQYLDQRLLFYGEVDEPQLQQINAHTVQLQAEL